MLHIAFLLNLNVCIACWKLLIHLNSRSSSMENYINHILNASSDLCNNGNYSYLNISTEAFSSKQTNKKTNERRERKKGSQPMGIRHIEFQNEANAHNSKCATTTTTIYLEMTKFHVLYVQHTLNGTVQLDQSNQCISFKASVHMHEEREREKTIQPSCHV